MRQSCDFFTISTKKRKNKKTRRIKKEVKKNKKKIKKGA
jgi:hypothetical protein